MLLGGGTSRAGRQGRAIRLLSLEKIRGTEAHRGGELQTVSTPSGRDLFTAPAVLHSGCATWIFAADNGATAAWTLEHDRLQPRWKNDTPGTSPVVAGGLLYVYSPRGGLHVYEPQTGKPVATLDCGGGHWNSPVVIDGCIALSDGNSNAHRTNGVLNIWRLPHAAENSADDDDGSYRIRKTATCGRWSEASMPMSAGVSTFSYDVSSSAPPGSYHT